MITANALHSPSRHKPVASITVGTAARVLPGAAPRGWSLTAEEILAAR